MTPCSLSLIRHSRRGWGRLSGTIALVLVAGFAQSGRADEPLRVMVDRLVAMQTADYEKIAAPVCSDEEFLRRIWLDLTGTIPSTADARAFLDDADSNKREKLVDRLLASPEYARHM